jgi:hypothetical protein
MSKAAAGAAIADDPKVCRICNGESGADLRPERQICDSCLGLAHEPRAPLPGDQVSELVTCFDVAEAFSGETGANPNIAKWPCPRCSAMTSGAKVGRNRTKVCPTCIKSKRTKSQKATFAKRKANAETVALAEIDSKPRPQKTEKLLSSEQIREAREHLAALSRDNPPLFPDQPKPHATLPAIPTEIIIPLGVSKTPFSLERIVVRVLDMAAGPFLAIEGIDDEPADDDMNGHQFYLQSEAEIDALAAALKQILRQVLAAYGRE